MRKKSPSRNRKSVSEAEWMASCNRAFERGQRYMRSKVWREFRHVLIPAGWEYKNWRTWVLTASEKGSYDAAARRKEWA